MKKEIKKNNKMVLALVVVAALTMVSIAGIALQSEKSTAADLLPSIEMKNGNIVNAGTETRDYNFYVKENVKFGTLLFIVPEGATYSGTVRIGTLSDSGVYTPYSAIKLTGASSVQLGVFEYKIGKDVITFFTIGNSSVDAEVMPAGTYELMQGQVVLGSPTAAYDWSDFDGMYGFMGLLFTDSDFVTFCGTVSAGDFSVTAGYVYGAIVSITADGQARLSGPASSPDYMLPKDSSGKLPAASERTLSLSGEVSVQFPVEFQKAIDKHASGAWFAAQLGDGFVVDSINVTVEDGAVVTVGDRATAIASSVTVKAGNTIARAVLIDSDGNAIDGNTNNSGTTKIAEFFDVPLGDYKLLIKSPWGKIFFGNATVSASGLTVYSNSLPDSFIDDSAGTIFSAVAGALEYDDNEFRFQYAFNVSQGEMGVLEAPGKITFPHGFSSSDRVLLIMNSIADRQAKCFYGLIGNDSQGYDLLKKAAGAVPDSGEIKEGDLTLADTVVKFTVESTSAPSLAGEPSTLTVKGDINVLYNSHKNYGILDIKAGSAYVEFEGTGIISHGAEPIADSNVFGNLKKMQSPNLVAAYYWTNEGTASIKSTYYFTSLQNAVNNSNHIILVGDHIILVDTIFDNPAFDDITIIIGPDASLQVGREKIDDDNPAISAKLTIPSKTKLINHSGAGKYKVVNGQAIYDTKPAAANEPKADILIEGSKFIYTDLATALDISVSGDILETRDDAILVRDATVKSGVVLKDTGGLIEIPEDVTLTVNGTVESKKGFTIDGTLRINSTVNFDDAIVTLNGTIDVTSNGTLNVKGGTINNGIPDPNSVLQVNGTANLTNGAIVKVATLIVETGTLSIGSAPAALTVTDTMRVGAIPTLSTGYVNDAAISGKVTLGPAAVAYVYGSFSVTGLFANTATANTQYMIGSTLYVTLYCDNASSIKLPLLYEDQLLDIIIHDWWNDRFLRDENLNAYKSDPDPYIGDTGWKIVYAEFEYRTYKVTFSYLQGMTWVCNGIDISGGGFIMVEYGKSITVTASVQPGFEGTPALKAGSATYTAGTPYKVTAEVVFTASGVQQASSGGNDKGGLTLIEILLIIIVIIIAIIALIVAIRLLRS